MSSSRPPRLLNSELFVSANAPARTTFDCCSLFSSLSPPCYGLLVSDGYAFLWCCCLHTNCITVSGPRGNGNTATATTSNVLSHSPTKYGPKNRFARIVRRNKYNGEWAIERKWFCKRNKQKTATTTEQKKDYDIGPGRGEKRKIYFIFGLDEIVSDASPGIVCLRLSVSYVLTMWAGQGEPVRIRQ